MEEQELPVKNGVINLEQIEAGVKCMLTLLNSNTMEEQELPIKNGKIDLEQIETGVKYTLTLTFLLGLQMNSDSLYDLLKAYASSKRLNIVTWNNYKFNNVTILFKQVEGYV